MMTQTPGENASSRSRRAYHENWFVNLLAHVSCKLLSHSAFAMTSTNNPLSAHPEAASDPPGEIRKSRSKVFLMITAEVVTG